MGDRPVIPMSGQPAGAQPPQPPPPPVRPTTFSTTQSAPPSSMPPSQGKRFAGLGRGVKSFRGRVKRNPAIWWPVIIVMSVLIAGVVLSSSKSEKSATPKTVAPTTVAPTTPVSVAPKADGTLNDLIVHSVVSIFVYENGRACAVGSGSVVGDGLHVLTNHHVIASDKDCSVDEIRVRTMKTAGDLPEDTYIGTVLTSDEDIDLAILSLAPIVKGAPVLRPLELSTSYTVGEDVVVVGFPAVAGDSVTVSKGIISGFADQNGVKWIKTDTEISGGNSGGAALDSKNRLIGIPTMMSVSSSGELIDCRRVADTNSDGVIDDLDNCVPVGGSFSLMATSETAAKLAKKIGLDLMGKPAKSTTTTQPGK